MHKIFTIIFAGSILKIEPKRFSSGYPPERRVGLASLNRHWNSSILKFLNPSIVIFLTYRIIFTPFTFMIAHLLKVTILMCLEEIVQS